VSNKPNEHEICKGKKKKIKDKAVPVIGHGGPKGCETSRFKYFLDSPLTEDGEVVSLTSWLPYTPRKIPGTNFCCRLS
jgi:hypothetical protein